MVLRLGRAGVVPLRMAGAEHAHAKYCINARRHVMLVAARGLLAILSHAILEMLRTWQARNKSRLNSMVWSVVGSRTGYVRPTTCYSITGEDALAEPDAKLHMLQDARAGGLIGMSMQIRRS